MVSVSWNSVPILFPSMMERNLLFCSAATSSVYFVNSWMLSSALFIQNLCLSIRTCSRIHFSASPCYHHVGQMIPYAVSQTSSQLLWIWHSARTSQVTYTEHIFITTNFQGLSRTFKDTWQPCTKIWNSLKELCRPIRGKVMRLYHAIGITINHTDYFI